MSKRTKTLLLTGNCDKLSYRSFVQNTNMKAVYNKTQNECMANAVMECAYNF